MRDSTVSTQSGNPKHALWSTTPLNIHGINSHEVEVGLRLRVLESVLYLSESDLESKCKCEFCDKKFLHQAVDCNGDIFTLDGYMYTIIKSSTHSCQYIVSVANTLRVARK